ncbi:MAG TPA: extensin family protein [Devosia sp.]
MFAALLLMTIALPALAQEEPPPLPKPRPAEAVEPAMPLPRTDPRKSLPGTRAKTAAPAAEPAEHIDPEVDGPPAAPEPPRIYQSMCPAVIAGQVEAEMRPPISDGQCQAQSPLAVTGVLVNGRMVPLSGEVVTSCGMATALPGWVAEIDRYLFARENTRIAELVVGTSYMCRNVNNAEDGNLSFHSFAEAVDVVGFRLDDGRMVSVEGGWSDALSSEGRLLRFAHDAACARFSTTLGPEANALHKDHLHLDLGCHGARCEARLCE